MARYGMVIDTRKCVGCMDCVVACKTENQVPEGLNRDWIAYDTTGVFPTVNYTSSRFGGTAVHVLQADCSKSQYTTEATNKSSF